ncbi:MAG: GTP cyclohydrolase II [Saprospiraceae bacterium]|nr:GTP cyclohydrolase II [Saprospiraceae bacterium]|tara:strand:- start:280 stop:897 length:618 start_codon:yes stop_codon:yes gene_type:complete
MKEELRRLESAKIPTDHGSFEMITYESDKGDYSPHIAMVSKNFNSANPILVRVHSECITGDLFGSKRCDCGKQLDQSLKRIADEGGVLIYLRQEGRGIGIVNKLKAYNLQDDGLDTREANTALGFPIDERDFEIAINILSDLGVKSIMLMTNNPSKVHAFKSTAIDIVKREEIIIPPCVENLKYLQTKQDDMGHMLGMSIEEVIR